MYEISNGKPFPLAEQLEIQPYSDSVGYHLSGDGTDLFVIAYNKFTLKELQAFERGKIQFKFGTLNNVGFITIKFEDLNVMDTPISKIIIGEDILKTQYEQLKSNENSGRALHIIVIDTQSGQPIVALQRLMSFSNKFSTDFTKSIIELPSLTRQEFINNVTLVQSKYNSKQINSILPHRCTIQAH